MRGGTLIATLHGMKGAVGYFRVSTAEQAEKNNSIEVQQKKFTDFCRGKGVPALQTFTDKQSARTPDDRPQFQAMLAYCRKHRANVECVVVADLSRLARNVADQGHTMSALAQLGIKLQSIDEPNLDNSAIGKFSANVIGATNQLFSDSLSEKTKDRMKVALQKGRWLWVAPLGYLNEMTTKSIVLDPDRAPLVCKVFELIAQGKDSHTAFRLVHALGLTSRKGRPIPRQTLSRLIRNEFYAGRIRSGDLRIKGSHEPLVSEELFRRVQAKLNAVSRTRSSTTTSLFVDSYVVRDVERN
jgi:site-specific DNA recombinase